MRKIAECAGYQDGFLGFKPAEEAVEFLAGFGIGFKFEGSAEASDGLDRFKGANAFLFADRFPKQVSKETNILDEKLFHLREVADAGV
jgi:hypothetical protein